MEFACPKETFFLPDSVVTSISRHDYSLKFWLRHSAGVSSPSTYDYCRHLRDILCAMNNRKLVVTFAHLIYHAHLKNFLRTDEISKICHLMPVVDSLGHVYVDWTKTLVPAIGSNWVKIFGFPNFLMEEYAEENTLLGVNSVTAFSEKYVELGDVYSKSAQYSGEFTPENELLIFLVKHTGALDLPDVCPPNISLEVASTELSSDQAFLLLEWIRSLKSKNIKIPLKFIESIKNGKWMKTYSGFRSPNSCFLWNGREKIIQLKRCDISMILPVIDEDFYLNKIDVHKEELAYIGVQVSLEAGCLFVSNRLEYLSSTRMSKDCLLLLLKFMKFSSVRNESLVKTAQEGKWMRTNLGYVAPVGSVFLASELSFVSEISDCPVVDRLYYGNWLGDFVPELKLLGVVVDLEGVYKLTIEKFKLPDDLSTLSKESFLFCLECIQKSSGAAATSLTQNLAVQPLMRTSSGLKRPTEVILFNQEWQIFLAGVSVPLIDEVFYGIEIRLFIAELKQIGVAVDLEMVSEIIALHFKTLSSSHKLTGATVISLLRCIKCIRVKEPTASENFRIQLAGETWLETCHGCQYAWNSILPDSEWRALSEVADLPLIDEAFYGNIIYDFREELEWMRVVVDFDVGAPLIASGLKLPVDPTVLRADVTVSILQCIGHLQESSYHFEMLLEKLQTSMRLKTSLGYELPEACILHYPDWSSFLELEDAPFLDEKYYENFHSLEKHTLKSIGVKVDIEEACDTISRVLLLHRETSAVTRIYRFLRKFNWYPNIQDESLPWLWIPYPSGGKLQGKWVTSKFCVLHDKDAVVGLQLYVLENYYDAELLLFFSSSFGVPEFPGVKDYINLWKDWESGKSILTSTGCRSFWSYMLANWCLNVEEILQSNIRKLPASTISGAGAVLVDKEEVFIPDDLQLKKLFLLSGHKSLFVWCSPGSLHSLPRNELYKVYTSLGVRCISESVSINTQILPSDLVKVDSRKLIGKGLVKIVLCFLAGHCTTILMKDRQNTVTNLLELSVYESNEPCAVIYSLWLPSSRKRLVVEASRMVIWEKNCRRLIVQKLQSGDQKANVNFMTCFAQTVTEGLMPQGSADLVNNLCKIIQLGFTYGFQEDAVDALLANANLELSVEDRSFLDSAFSSLQTSFQSSKRNLLCSPMTPSPKRLR